MAVLGLCMSFFIMLAYIAGIALVVLAFVYYLVKQIKAKKKETFDDRDN